MSKKKGDEWYGRVAAAEVSIKKRFAARMKQLAEDPWDKRYELRNEAARRYLVPGHYIVPSDLSSRLNFRDHGDLLEAEWPGCSVMWDAHPDLKHWQFYCLMVVWNYVSRPPFGSRSTTADSIAHRKHKKQVARIVDEASVEGLLILVAYMLHMPSRKPAQIAVDTTELRGGQTSRMVENNVPALRTITTSTPVRAIYTASETRWTLVR